MDIALVDWTLYGRFSFAGTEALFADLGHFNRPSIQLSTYSIVYPALMITYLGQVRQTSPDLQAGYYDWGYWIKAGKSQGDGCMKIVLGFSNWQRKSHVVCLVWYVILGCKKPSSAITSLYILTMLTQISCFCI